MSISRLTMKHCIARTLPALFSVPVFLSALSLLSCFAPEPPPLFNETRRVVPEIEENIAPENFEYFEENSEEFTSLPRVPLDSDEELMRAFNVNLDLDTNDEQILLIRQFDNPQSLIRVAVVDFDSVRNSYSRTWERETQSTNARTFDVTLKDLVGDHNLEIVCRGMNSNGELTLDVFRKTPSPSGVGLYFSSICSIVTDGSIEVEELERSEGYRMGQKNGPSFPIYSYTQDLESENLLDRIKRAYHWQYQQNRYVLTSEETLPGEVIEEQQLRELFSGTEIEPFEQFLAGPWYLADSQNKEEILLFLPQERIISIYSGDVQEMYAWKDSFRSLSNRLLIFAENLSITSIVKQIRIEVKALNTIDVAIIGTEQWDRFYARYIKLSDEVQEDLLRRERAAVRLSDLQLTGLYRSDQGIEIIFEPPHFTWLAEEKEFSGGFTLIELNELVLYLKGLDRNGLPTEEFTFVMDYSEKKENNHLYRTLTLIPGLMGVHGVNPISEDKIIFEQFEVLEESEEAPTDGTDDAGSTDEETAGG